MKILKFCYEKIKKKPAPYYYNYSLVTVLAKPLRKWLVNVVASNCVFNTVRKLIYRICGFKIGKNVFIGMHCYLDDMCYDLITIEDNVTISYGVYFACHGIHQKHNPITIKHGSYIGMRSSLITSGGGLCIGPNAIVGAMTLVNKSVDEGATVVGVPGRVIEKS